MLRHSPIPGFTLIELLICLGVIALLLELSVTPTRNLAHRARATAAVNWLVAAIVHTRHSAIVLRSTVTLCPSASGARCEGSWHQGMINFTDRNEDGQVGPGDLILQRFRPPQDDMRLQWRSFRHRAYLQMIPEGTTNFQNGNFLYCPADGDARFARQLIINMPGRVRQARDSNRDGYVEDRNGKRLTC